MTYLRIAAVALTVLCAALLIWLYGIKTTLVWTAAMAAFLGVLYLATTPLRRRQERALRALGLDRHGRPLPEIAEEEEGTTRPPPTEAADDAAGRHPLSVRDRCRPVGRAGPHPRGPHGRAGAAALRAPARRPV